ncbi:hypothetical protein J1N35_001428, partial [Gossypium stocksii]
VFQADHYFTFHNIHEQDRLTISSFYLDDAAAKWYDWMYQNKQLSGWTHFTVALTKQFQHRILIHQKDNWQNFNSPPPCSITELDLKLLLIGP